MTDRTNAIGIGLACAGLCALGMYVGSGGLRHFDPALFWYAVGSVGAAFAVGYRFTRWAGKPPTRVYLRRGIQLLLARRAQRREGRRRTPAAPTPAGTAGRAVASKFLGQTFIRRRSAYRWVMHLCLSGGCTLAFAITFPLVFGWVHFSTPLDSPEIYEMRVFGFAVDRFGVHGLKAFIVFNLLNFAAIIVLIGLVMAMARRLFDAGERATQKFMEDWLPLLLILAVTATGLALTVSYKILGGAGHGTLVVVHMISVLALIFYIPFGKLFHMFQRICSLCVSLYREEGESGPQAYCVRCGDAFASQMHVNDLKDTLDDLGFDYRFATQHGTVHYQDICPACRRGMLALNQGKSIGR